MGTIVSPRFGTVVGHSSCSSHSGLSIASLYIFFLSSDSTPGVFLFIVDAAEHGFKGVTVIFAALIYGVVGLRLATTIFFFLLEILLRDDTLFYFWF